MPKVGETATAVKEHLGVGRIQLAIGEFCLATVAVVSVPTEYITHNLTVVRYGAAFAAAEILGAAADKHFYQGRRQMARKKLNSGRRI